MLQLTTDDADLPTFSLVTLVPEGCELSIFRPVGADEVITALQSGIPECQ